MKKYLPYLLLLLALGAALGYFVYKNAPSTLEQNESEFAIKNMDDITQVNLTDQSNKKVVLTKKGKQWFVNDVYPIREESLSLLFTAFQKMKTLSPVPQNAQQNVLKDMVQSCVKCEIFLDNDNTPSKVYRVGGATLDGHGTYMIMEIDGKIAKQPYITYIPGMDAYLTPRYHTNLEEWRTRWIFKNTVEEIKSLSVEYNEDKQKSFYIQQVEDDSFTIANSNKVVEAQPKQRYIQQYLTFYDALAMEAYENTNAIKDSILRTAPYCTVTITKTDGTTKKATLYYMPLNERSPTRADENGRQLLYDIDHYYATINDGKDFVLIQFYSWGKVLRSYQDFFVKPKATKP